MRISKQCILIIIVVEIITVTLSASCRPKSNLNEVDTWDKRRRRRWQRGERGRRDGWQKMH
jgi:hypothetical protein